MDSNSATATKKRKRPMLKCKCCQIALTSDYHFIYDDRGIELNIETLLYEAVGIQVSESDGAQQAICDACLQQTIQTYEFKQRCWQANLQNDGDHDSDGSYADGDGDDGGAERNQMEEEHLDESEVWDAHVADDVANEVADETEFEGDGQTNMKHEEIDSYEASIDEELVQSTALVKEEKCHPSSDLSIRPAYRGPIGTRNLREYMSTLY